MALCRYGLRASLSFAVLFAVVGAGAQSTVQYITMRDTREQAFSLDVPAGWHVHGGMYRLGIVSPEPLVNMQSPDGRIEIRIGDFPLPSYAIPTPQMARLGITEGHIMQQTDTAPIVARYRTGEDFASAYGKARFASACQALQQTQTRSAPPRITQPAANTHATAGEAFFTCTLNGQPRLGYVWVETAMIGSQAGGIWYIAGVFSLLAPPSQAAAAGDILKHCAASYVKNPVWSAVQDRNAGAANLRIAEQYKREHAAMQAQVDRANRALDQSTATMSDILTGTTLTRDPATGRVREITGAPSGSTFWQSNNGVAVASSLSPGTGFTPLENIPR